MITSSKPRYILMLEDDPEDRYITESFFIEKGYDIKLQFVTNGEEVMDFLYRCDRESLPYPELILLDKIVPIGSGMEVLREIKRHPVYKMIPVVMISGTASPADIIESYSLGINSYIIKPDTNQLTSKKIETFVSYWFETVELPELARGSEVLA